MVRAPARTWTRHLVHRSERLRTTWKLRLAVLALVGGLTWATAGWWTIGLARSLACQANKTPSDAIVVENFEVDNYLVFERAGELRRAGLASRIMVPVMADAGSGEPNAVALATANVVAGFARTGGFDVVPIREIEPISLNAARAVQRVAERDGLRSVIIVSPFFRSQRSALVYGATLGAAHIAVTCEPVEGMPGVQTWTATWHGIQNVAEQWLKLQYYRLFVLPFHQPS